MTTKLIAVTIEGVTPLMFNPQLREKVSKDIDPKKLAEMKIHRDPKGKPCIPKLMLVRAMIDAGRHVQYKKMANFTKGNAPNVTTIVTSCVDIIEEHLLITPATWELDQQPFNAHNGPTISRPTEGSIRPKFPRGWKASFTLEYDTDDPIITEEKIQELLRVTGKKIGLGSFRVVNTGFYGKFIIAEWKPKKK